MITPAHERKAAERQRKKAAGLVRCEVWVPADDAWWIRNAVEMLLAIHMHNKRIMEIIRDMREQCPSPKKSQAYGCQTRTCTPS